jgi:hypothetical protein
MTCSCQRRWAGHLPVVANAKSSNGVASNSGFRPTRLGHPAGPVLRLTPEFSCGGAGSALWMPRSEAHLRQLQRCVGWQHVGI